MKFFFKLAFFLLPISMVVAVPLHGPHEHGTLAVAVSKQDAFLSLKMVITSQDLLGFEGSPKSDRQKKQVSDQYAKLYKEESLPNLFQFFPAEACFPYSSNMESDMLTYHEHAEEGDDTSADHDDTHSVGDEDGHSDFELTYVFECDDVEILQISFSNVFPSINKVDFYGKGELKGDVVRSTEASMAFVSAEDLK